MRPPRSITPQNQEQEEQTRQHQELKQRQQRRQQGKDVENQTVKASENTKVEPPKDERKDESLAARLPKTVVKEASTAKEDFVIDRKPKAATSELQSTISETSDTSPRSTIKCDDSPTKTKQVKPAVRDIIKNFSSNTAAAVEKVDRAKNISPANGRVAPKNGTALQANASGMSTSEVIDECCPQVLLISYLTI